MTAPHPECNCAEMAALVADLRARVDAIQPVIVASFEWEGRDAEIPAVLRPPAVPRPSLTCLPGGAA